MRNRDLELLSDLLVRIRSYEARFGAFPGVDSDSALRSLVCQIIESLRRRKFVELALEADISVERANPDSGLFDPIRASILHNREEQTDEAFWLVFLATHFGKHRYDGWRACAEFYRGDGVEARWSFDRVVAEGASLARWLRRNSERFSGRFGNHRKYESTRADSARSLDKIVASYIDWIVDSPQQCHESKFEEALEESEFDPKLAFENLFRSMDSVLSFGRTAKFDYLTMLSKVRLATIEPDSCHLRKATGPFAAAKLLFGARGSSARVRDALDAKLIHFGAVIGLPMDVLEDSLCNWQKSPEEFVPFRG